MNRTVGWLLTAIAGAVAGLFLAGPLVMADGPIGERAVVLGVTAGAYLLLGALAGYWLRTWTAGLLLSTPGVIVALFLGEGWQVVLPSLAAVLVSAVGGALVGARWRRP